MAQQVLRLRVPIPISARKIRLSVKLLSHMHGRCATSFRGIFIFEPACMLQRSTTYTTTSVHHKTAMAPAIKRRKIKHNDEINESVAGDTSHGTHASAGSLAEELDEDDTSDAGHQEQAKNPGPVPKRALVSKTSTVAKPHKRPDAPLQDGVYTAESFKSNVFKLQIDELLEQVKPKYGKKEAPAENAMRILKSVIEQLPSRAPLSVCNTVWEMILEC